MFGREITGVPDRAQNNWTNTRLDWGKRQLVTPRLVGAPGLTGTAVSTLTDYLGKFTSAITPRLGQVRRTTP